MIFIGYLLYTCCTSYIGIFDVGSTGTRLHLYGYNGDRITSLNSYNNYPGLGTLEDDKIIQSLIQDLVQKAMNDLKIIKSIPLGVYCTAGFREIDSERANHKLKVISKTLEDFNLTEIKILSGEEEGYLAFVSLLLIIENSRKLNNFEDKNIVNQKDHKRLILNSSPSKGTYGSSLYNKSFMDHKKIIFKDRMDEKNVSFLMKDSFSGNIGLLDMGGMSVQVTFNKGKRIFTKSLEVGFKESNQQSPSKTEVQGVVEKDDTFLGYKKNIKKKISGVEKIPDLSMLRKIYLASFFTDTLKKYVGVGSITLKDIFYFYRDFCEHTGLESDLKNFKECKDLFLIVSFLVN